MTTQAEEFYLVFGERRRAFIDEVNIQLQAGWVLFGEPYMSTEGHRYQAMIKPKTTTPQINTQQ